VELDTDPPRAVVADFLLPPDCVLLRIVDADFLLPPDCVLLRNADAGFLFPLVLAARLLTDFALLRPDLPLATIAPS